MQRLLFWHIVRAFSEYGNQKSLKICKSNLKWENFKILKTFVAGVYLILMRAISFLIRLPFRIFLDFAESSLLLSTKNTHYQLDL